MSEAADSIGAMATAGLLAREIDRARDGAPAVGHNAGEPCSNCGAARIGAYCHDCGQAGHVHRDLAALVHDIAHGVFHFEGKIWNTLPLLAWRPGELTRRYCRGERAKFVSPMALFLFSVFLMFAVVSNLPGHTKITKAPPEAPGLVKLRAERKGLETRIAVLQGVRATLPAGASQQEMDARIAGVEKDLKALEFPLRVRSVMAPAPGAAESDDRARMETNGFGTGLGWFDRMVGHAAKNPELAAYKIKSYGYKYSWALIPISLPFIWLLFAWRRDVGFYDHAIFSIYSLAFMSLMVVALVVLSAIGIPTVLIVLAAMLIPPVHMYRQLKGAYLLGRWGAGWRTVALLVITTITSTLFLAFLFWMGNE